MISLCVAVCGCVWHAVRQLHRKHDCRGVLPDEAFHGCSVDCPGRSGKEHHRYRSRQPDGAMCTRAVVEPALGVADSRALTGVVVVCGGGCQSVMPWTPIRGGHLIPMQPLAAWSQGGARAIPVIVTFARNSSEVFVYREFPSAMSPIEYPVVRPPHSVSRCWHSHLSLTAGCSMV